jgi:tripartite-type tricarboxylate transporter receptor subunit TctC
LLAFAFSVGTGPTCAQLPGKGAVRILVPIPPGGTTDTVARLIADRVRDDFGKPVIVENKAGASGRIAVDALRNAAPDGATVLLAPIAIPVIAPLIFNNHDYDSVADLVPIAQVSTYEFALAVAANHPARNVREFVAWAKINPIQATFGTSGRGSLPHLIGVMLGKAAHIELLHVPYKGVTSVEAHLIGGQLGAAISSVPDFITLHQAGKLRILATSGTKRSPLLPDVPTFREQEYPSIEALGWHALYAPSGTPPAAIDRWCASIASALRAPDVRERVIALGLRPTGTDPKELAAIMAADTLRWRSIIESAGFTAE